MRTILDRIAQIFGSGVLVMMVFVTCWQVFTRYVLNSPSGFSEELLRYSLIWLTMIGGAYAYGQKKHLAITFVVNKASEKTQKLIGTIVDIMVLCFAGIVLIRGGSLTFTTAVGQVSAALRMPMQFLYLSLIVCGILIFFYAACNIHERFTQK